MTNNKTSGCKMEHDAKWNPNPECYELLAPYYADIYGEIDAKETVRQWWQLLTTVTNLVSTPPQTLRLLDIGCGPGWHMEAWQEMGFTVAGIDASSAMLALARSLFKSKHKPADFYLADIADSGSVPTLPLFDLAVSHFNFLNLFPPHQRETVFQNIARLVRPGGFWITDFSEPTAIPEATTDTIKLKTGDLMYRKGQYNYCQGFYRQDWWGLLPLQNAQERYWFGHYSAAKKLATSTGWILCLRKEWHPYRSEIDEIWSEPTGGGDIFIDIYQLKGYK